MLQIAVKMLPSSSFSHETEIQSTQIHKTTPAEKIKTPLPVFKSKDPDPMEKTTSNVRKMISAYESGKLKDVKSLKRAASVPPEQKAVRKESSLEGQEGFAQPTDERLRKTEVAHLSENLSQNLMNVSGQDLVSSDSKPFPDLKELESSVGLLDSSEITQVKPTVEESNRSPVALTSSYMPKQDVEKSLERAALAQPEYIIAGKEGSLDEKDEKGIAQSTDQSLGDFENTLFTGNLNKNTPSVSRLGDLDSSDTEPSFAPKELESSVAPMELDGEESDGSPVDLTRQSVSETATSPRRKYEVQYQETEASDSSAAEEEESEIKTGFEGSKVMDIQGTSDLKPESLDFDKEEHNSPESSGVWRIFPHNACRLCIITADNQVMKILEIQHIEADTHHEKEVSLESEILEPRQETHETDIGNMPESCSFPDDSHNRRIGQAIKVAAILGLGVLVLLTRKKEARKKKSEESDFLFRIPDYVDEITTE